VLNKPSGIASVTQDPSHPETAMGWALAKFPELAKIIRKPGKKEAGLLNRLDTGTSGILIFAKDQKTFDLAWNLWKSSQIQKIYRCLVTSPASLQTISYPLTKHPRSSKKMLAIIRKSQHVRDRLFPATTHLLKKHGPPSDHQQQIIDLEVQIVTGVRHQIRAHLAAIHCPILGDLLYRGKPSNRLWLHAWTLTLKFPDQKFHWEAPLPQTWIEAF
jgi:23S rRNA pseudouridine1911/1915/1917 synthase